VTTARTNGPISENQQAVIKKYGFEVFEEGGMWHVNDEVMYRKNALKDASKKGRYQASTLDAALKQAVAVRKEDEGSGHATPRADSQEPTGDEMEAAKPAGKTKAKTKAKAEAPEAENVEVAKPAAKTKGKKAEEAEPAEKKPQLKKGERKKDHRFLRAFRVIAADPKVTPEVIANKATMSVKMAGGCILAWNAAMQVLEETKAKPTKNGNGKK
jgi:hypothetical protein